MRQRQIRRRVDFGRYNPHLLNPAEREQRTERSRDHNDILTVVDNAHVQRLARLFLSGQRETFPYVKRRPPVIATKRATNPGTNPVKLARGHDGPP